MHICDACGTEEGVREVRVRFLTIGEFIKTFAGTTHAEEQEAASLSCCKSCEKAFKDKIVAMVDRVRESLRGRISIEPMPTAVRPEKTLDLTERGSGH